MKLYLLFSLAILLPITQMQASAPGPREQASATKSPSESDDDEFFDRMARSSLFLSSRPTAKTEFTDEMRARIVLNGGDISFLNRDGAPSPCFDDTSDNEPPIVDEGGKPYPKLCCTRASHMHRKLEQDRTFIEATHPQTGITAFMLAMRNNMSEAENTRMFSCNPNIARKDKKGRNALYYNVQNNHPSSVSATTTLLTKGIETQLIFEDPVEHLCPKTVDYNKPCTAPGCHPPLQITALQLAQRTLNGYESSQEHGYSRLHQEDIPVLRTKVALLQAHPQTTQQQANKAKLEEAAAAQ